MSKYDETENVKRKREKVTKSKRKKIEEKETESVKKTLRESKRKGDIGGEGRKGGGAVLDSKLLLVLVLVSAIALRCVAWSSIHDHALSRSLSLSVFASSGVSEPDRSVVYNSPFPFPSPLRLHSATMVS